MHRQTLVGVLLGTRNIPVVWPAAVKTRTHHSLRLPQRPRCGHILHELRPVRAGLCGEMVFCGDVRILTAIHRNAETLRREKAWQG